MNFIALVCPRCGRRLTVSANAPRLITCPNCLGRIENPGPPPEMEPIASQPPLPVMPLEHEASRDAAAANAGVILIGAVLVLGVLMALFSITPSARGYAGSFLLVGIVLAMMIAVATVIAAGRRVGQKYTSREYFAGADTLLGCLGRAALAFLIVIGVCALIFLSICGAIIFSIK